ncbi:MAG TPA: DUF1398 family protein [Candidatus Babeliaceae bacterium]|nr:DUF1398 family protein [Candidatus Babeliaceae bacterium]
MINTKQLATIIERSQIEKWAYPYTFKQLQSAGVANYTVELSTPIAFYRNSNNVIEFQEIISKETLQISKQFCIEKLEQAIDRHQQLKTNYLELLRELADAGVTRYKVDMKSRMITYYGSQLSQNHKESIPVID